MKKTAKIDTDIEKIKEFLSRGVEQVIIRESLEKKLQSGKKLRVKHGVDPTTKDLHLGYAVVYEKLRQLQEMGHQIVFLIGDFTARFGDPTDQKKTRGLRNKKEIEACAKNYIKQIGKILDVKKL
ncbi:MAG: tyrosine--tRNA ligase, partial [Promethearchaeota archaeon]